jgi:hypothetical protein
MGRMTLDTDAATIVRLTEELAALPRPMELMLKPESVLMLVALVQLALRHPHAPPSARAFGEQFISAARAYYAGSPTALEVIDRGDRR